MFLLVETWVFIGSFVVGTLVKMSFWCSMGFWSIVRRPCGWCCLCFCDSPDYNELSREEENKDNPNDDPLLTQNSAYIANPTSAHQQQHAVEHSHNPPYVPTIPTTTPKQVWGRLRYPVVSVGRGFVCWRPPRWGREVSVGSLVWRDFGEVFSDFLHEWSTGVFQHRELEEVA